MYHDVGLLDTTSEEFTLGAIEEGFDDARVPACVDDTDAQAAAIVLLWSRAFDRHGGRMRRRTVLSGNVGRKPTIARAVELGLRSRVGLRALPKTEYIV